MDNSLAECLTTIFLVATTIVLYCLFSGFCTQYTVEFWVLTIKHHPAHLAFLPCCIAGLFLGELMIPAAATTFLISMIIN